MTELPYIEKMYAACVVADYILRHMVSHGKQQKEQTNLHQHPFSILLDKNHKQLRLEFNVRQEFKQGYESLRTNLSNQLKLPSYDSFYRKVEDSRRLFSLVATQITGIKKRLLFSTNTRSRS